MPLKKSKKQQAADSSHKIPQFFTPTRPTKRDEDAESSGSDGSEDEGAHLERIPTGESALGLVGVVAGRDD